MNDFKFKNKNKLISGISNQTKDEYFEGMVQGFLKDMKLYNKAYQVHKI